MASSILPGLARPGRPVPASPRPDQEYLHRHVPVQERGQAFPTSSVQDAFVSHQHQRRQGAPFLFGQVGHIQGSDFRVVLPRIIAPGCFQACAANQSDVVQHVAKVTPAQPCRHVYPAIAVLDQDREGKRVQRGYPAKAQATAGGYQSEPGPAQARGPLG